MNQITTIELLEYKPVILSSDRLSLDIGEDIWRNYSKQIKIEFPTPISNMCWKITSLGWVGRLKLNNGISLLLKPKVPIKNLFKMWEYAYRLNSFYLLEGLIECDKVEDFYNQLAMLLANKILSRSSKGLYKSYKEVSEILPYVRGNINIEYSIKSICSVSFKCDYEEQTTDIEDNKVLLYTTYTILRSGMCNEKVSKIVRRAYNSLQIFCSLLSFSGNQCIGKKYNRLNEDYRSMHAICRFFLNQVGPSYLIGNYDMLPFLVDMSRLFELFVSEWLKIKLPKEFDVKAQETVYIGNNEEKSINIDLVVYNKMTNKVEYVLDTKYKDPESPSQTDINQMITYAITKECNKAILVYPTEINNPFIWDIKNIKVSSLTFSLNNDIERNGKEFLEKLLSF